MNLQTGRVSTAVGPAYRSALGVCTDLQTEPVAYRLSASYLLRSGWSSPTSPTRPPVIAWSTVFRSPPLLYWAESRMVATESETRNESFSKNKHVEMRVGLILKITCSLASCYSRHSWL